MSKDGGNLKSMEVSGQIIEEMFDKCYGYHLIDLFQGASSLVSDSISQAYSITLTNISKYSVKYHFILFFNREININPTTSEIIM
jgi:16S rRNA G966 N2-methylase RsmD